MSDFAPQKVKTQAAGDVQVDLTHYNGGPVGAANAVHVQPGTGAVFTVGVVGGTVEVSNDAGNPLPVSGTVTADTELPAAVALADNMANPTAPAVGAYNLGWDAAGANWDRLIAVGGRLQVDVISGGGGTAPTTPLVEPFATGTDLAAQGATQDLSTADIGLATKKLARITVSGAGAIKAIVKSVVNGAETILDYLFVPQGGGSVFWKPPHPNYAVCVGSGAAGFDGFRVTLANEDPQMGFKGYATFFTES